MGQQPRLSVTTALLIVILMIFVFFCGIGIIMYMAFKIDTSLSIGALVFGFFGLLWFRQSGWYLLPKDIRKQVINVLPFRKN